MPTKTHQKPVTQLFYDAVRKEFSKLSEVKELGVKKYSNDYILAKLAEKFYRSPRTIENIVFYRTGTEPLKYVQTNLFS